MLNSFKSAIAFKATIAKRQSIYYCPVMGWGCIPIRPIEIADITTLVDRTAELEFRLRANGHIDVVIQRYVDGHIKAEYLISHFTRMSNTPHKAEACGIVPEYSLN